MPKWMEKRGEGYAKHLDAKPGSERYDKIKYGTMYSLGWEARRRTQAKTQETP